MIFSTTCISKFIALVNGDLPYCSDFWSLWINVKKCKVAIISISRLQSKFAYYPTEPTVLRDHKSCWKLMQIHECTSNPGDLVPNVSSFYPTNKDPSITRFLSCFGFWPLCRSFNATFWEHSIILRKRKDFSRIELYSHDIHMYKWHNCKLLYCRRTIVVIYYVGWPVGNPWTSTSSPYDQA